MSDRSGHVAPDGVVEPPRRLIVAAVALGLMTGAFMGDEGSAEGHVDAAVRTVDGTDAQSSELESLSSACSSLRTRFASP